MHVKIKFDGNVEETVVIDGHDITKAVLAGGLSVEFPDTVNSTPIVTIRVVPRYLEIDLPTAEVTAEPVAQPRAMCEDGDQ